MRLPPQFLLPVFALVSLTAAFLTPAAAVWKSDIVYYDQNGRLTYEADENGQRIVDFSHAGYRGGEQAIPNVPVVHTISPVGGDNTNHIQSAINTVAAMPLVNGHRGTILLRAGTYRVNGIIYIHTDGIVLRGEGQGGSGSDTIVVATGTLAYKELGTIVIKSNTGLNRKEGGTEQNIVSEFIPAGSRSLEVEDASMYSVGDQMVIEHLPTHEWLLAVNYGNTYGDTAGEWGDTSSENMYFYGTITAIDGNKIKLDTPIYHEIDRSLVQATIYRHPGTGVVEECGVENLRVVIENTGGSTNESHRWDGVHFIGARNCWVKDSTAIGFAESGFRFSRSTRSTALNCSALEPVAQISGGRRYNFYVGEDAHDILFKQCRASYGRHCYVVNGAAGTNGVVFTQSSSEDAYSASENHRRWGSAFLWDDMTWNNANTSGAVLALYNRQDYGTAHGWTGTGQVAWNIKTQSRNSIICSEPPIGQNFAVGGNSSVTGWTYPTGHVEYSSGEMEITSLYEAQLAERLTHGTGPDMPGRLRVSHYTNNASPFVVLEWLDIALEETAYVVERSTNGGNAYSVIATLPADSASYTDTAVTQNGNYTYRVSATNSIGRSAYSNPVTLNLSSVELPEVIEYHPLDNTARYGCAFRWDRHGYTGKGYIDMGSPDTWFEMQIDGGKGGPTNITFRYGGAAPSSGSGKRSCSVSINGEIRGQTVFSTPSSSWDFWGTETITVNLDRGINTIRLQPNQGDYGPNVDRIDVQATPVIYAAGETRPSQTAAMAFDSNNATQWRHASPHGSWLQYAYAAPDEVFYYQLTSGSGSSANDPASWQLLGSNNHGNSWTVLDTRSGQSFSSRGQTKTFNVANRGSYSLYRLDISGVNNLANADSVQLAEMEFFLDSSSPVDDDPIVSFEPAPSAIASGDSLQLTVNASDFNEIDRVYLYKDGVELSRSEGGAPYDFGLPGQNDTELENLQTGTYEFRALAVDTLGNEGEATIYVIVLAPGELPPPNINFQPASATVPAGYLPDTSQVFGDRGNGYSYGWGAAFDLTRERNSNADQRLDTLNHTQVNGDHYWEIELANGLYDVSITGGDPNHDDSFVEFIAEAGTGNEVTLVSASSTGVNFVSGAQTVAVTDGRLSISNGPSATNNKINYIDIDMIPDVDHPLVSFASPPATLVAGENLELTVNASDSSGINRVYLYKDGVELSRSEGGAPYEWGAAGQNDLELQNLPAGVYEFKAVAEDILGKESEASIQVAVLTPLANINFQPASSAVPSGYLADTSKVYGDRGNGFLYGWEASFDVTRDRGTHADQRFDTLNHTQANGADHYWEIEVPNGEYVVSITGGDPSHDDSFVEFIAEEGSASEVTLVSDSTTGVNFSSGTQTVTVIDGRLTISNGPSAINNKINFVEIYSSPSVDHPIVSFESPPTTIVEGEDLPLTVNASDSNGIERVYLYKNGVELSRSEGAAPYDFGAPGQNDSELQNLSAGVYEFKAVAEDYLGYASEVTINVTVTISPVNINFQPASAAIPSGYLADTSAVFGDRGNGYSYGWDAAFDQTRDRNSHADQRFDTLNHTQVGGDHYWEIELANGEYNVSITGGDPNHDDSFVEFVAEAGTANELTLASGDSAGVNFVSGSATVTVSDGRLTISNGPNAVNNKICFLEISGGIIASDGEGNAYEVWKSQHTITDDLGDEDNDGISNLLEFALGGDPRSAGNVQFPQISMNGNDFQFKLQRHQPGISYIVEKSTDLIEWQPYQTIADSDAYVGEEATITLPAAEMSNGKLFLRLRVTN